MLAKAKGNLSSGSLGGTCWGLEGRHLWVWILLSLHPQPAKGKLRVQQEPPNSGGSSWRLGFHLPFSTSKCRPGDQMFSSFCSEWLMLLPLKHSQP